MSTAHDAYLDPLLPASQAPGVYNAEVDELLVTLEDLSVREASADRFYAGLLDAVRTALNAAGASFWRRVGDGLCCETERVDTHHSDTPRPAPRRLLAILAAGEPGAVPLGDRPESPVALVCPVASAKRPVGVLVAVAPASMGRDKSLLGVLAAFAELADQFELRRRLTTLEEDAHTAGALQALSLQMQRVRSVRSAARTIAEEGRRLVGCDRLTVAVRSGGRWRVAAMSGVERPSPRSNAVRAVERLLSVATRSGETVLLRDGASNKNPVGGAPGAEHPPQLADALQRYVDSGYARELQIVPCRVPQDTGHPSDTGPIQAVLLVEQFDGRLPEECEAVTALVAEQTAATIERVGGVGWARRGGLAAWARRAAVAGLVAATLLGAVAALTLTPAELRVAAEGRLVPSQRARVFAPMDATVRSVLVEHGETVAAGQPLVELRSDTLEIELEQAREAFATTRSEIGALETAKLQAGLPGFQQETDLSAITSRIESLAEQTKHQQRRIDLLQQQQSRLVVVSPMAGRVVSWRPNAYLGARPVRRGQRLLEVAAVPNNNDNAAAGAWTIEINVPDHRAAPLLAAAEADRPVLIDYVMKSDPARERRGEVLRIAPITQADAAGEPVVRVDVRPVADAAPPSADASLRSGATVLAKIRCGQHSLGYVWFHEAWEAIQRAWF